MKKNNNKPFSKNIIDVDSVKKDKKLKQEFIKNNKLKLKVKQKFKSVRHNIFAEEIDKIGISFIDDKRI